jgi:hypothetical protein
MLGQTRLLILADLCQQRLVEKAATKGFLPTGAITTQIRTATIKLAAGIDHDAGVG